MQGSKGPLPDYMQAAFRGKHPVIIHGIEYRSADEVPDKWRRPGATEPADQADQADQAEPARPAGEEK